MLKTVSSVANALGALNYKGTWNATTNTPTLASGVGTQGDYYVVSVAGATDLDGITNWGVGDWAAFNGSVWQRVEGGADGNFVNLDVTGDLTVDTNSLYVNSTNNEVCIGQLTSINAGKFNVKGDSAHNGISATPHANSYYNYYGTNTAGGSTFYVRGDGISNFAGEMTVAAQLNNTGNHVITSGNVKVSSGYGIDFSATAGTGTSELLDDYEEAIWSPVLTGSTSGSQTFTNTGRSTLVGRLMSVEFGLEALSSSDVTGNLIMSLPATYTGYSIYVPIQLYQLNHPANAYSAYGFLEASTAVLKLFWSIDNAGSVAITNSDLPAGADAYIRGAFSYITS